MVSVSVLGVAYVDSPTGKVFVWGIIVVKVLESLFHYNRYKG